MPTICEGYNVAGWWVDCNRPMPHLHGILADICDPEPDSLTAARAAYLAADPAGAPDVISRQEPHLSPWVRRALDGTLPAKEYRP